MAIGDLLTWATPKSKIFVLTTKSWRISSFLTTGVIPVTSPPVVAGNIDLSLLEGNDILYIRLHGIEGQPFFYGDPGFPTTLSATQVQSLDLTGTEIFLEGCYGGLMADAFLSAGALSVVGSNKPTYGRRFRKGPSSIVGSNYLKMRKRGIKSTTALTLSLRKIPAKSRGKWSIKENERITI
jgi:hypothetical protein